MKLLVVQCAALGRQLWERRHNSSLWRRLHHASVRPPFPAVTCVAQASFRTATEPWRHGVVANGVFDKTLRKVSFWEQSSRVVQGPRIWDGLRNRGGRVGLFCWQQSLGDDADLVLSPAPVHKHHGGMIQAWHSRPASLHADLTRGVGRNFDLKSYWGPFASVKSTNWIADATVELLLRHNPPDLLLTYLPHLDYVLQKAGPEGLPAEKAFTELERCLERLAAAAVKTGYELLIFGDYAITAAASPLFPNKALFEAGLLATRNIGGMLYPDLFSSRAFAMVDHQVAHVYGSDAASVEAARAALGSLEGLEPLLDKSSFPHERAGDLILVAKPGRWLAYPWWGAPSQAPDYARHVDIHNKPGYDPCELFFGLWPPFSVSLDASRIRGTHGRSSGSPDEMAYLGSTVADLVKASTLEEAAGILKQML